MSCIMYVCKRVKCSVNKYSLRRNLSLSIFFAGDVLLNYCFEDDFMNVARFAYAMTIVLTYPIECFVTREVIENSVFATKEPQLGRHILITVIIAILTCCISMATECIEVVLQFNVSQTLLHILFFGVICLIGGQIATSPQSWVEFC